MENYLNALPYFLTRRSVGPVVWLFVPFAELIDKFIFAIYEETCFPCCVELFHGRTTTMRAIVWSGAFSSPLFSRLGPLEFNLADLFFIPLLEKCDCKKR